MIFRKMKDTLRSHIVPMALATAILVAMAAQTVSAKSVYIIADRGRYDAPKAALQAYDMAFDGTLTFQIQCDIPRRMLGATGLAIDSDDGYLFVTYDYSNEIHIVDALMMTNVDTLVVAPDSANLAGIVYDHKKKRVYCAENGTRTLHVFGWQPQTITLTAVSNSPVNLKRASAYGLALDEDKERLYVANGTNTITVYNTSNWRLVESITLNRSATRIAIDVRNDFVYSGGGSADNKHLTQYHLVTGTKREVQVEPDANVKGIAVDPDTGFIYISTSNSDLPGRNNLLVYDASLKPIDIVANIGNPSRLAVPTGDFGYNPLNLSKAVAENATGAVESNGLPTVGAGDELTYVIGVENNTAFTVTDVSVGDMLPEELTFVAADGSKGDGQYDPKTHTYEWSYSSLAPGSSVSLELTAQAGKDVPAGTVVVNTARIISNETAPATKAARVEVTNNALNLNKTVSGQINDPVAGTDPGDPLNYTITFNNNDNDFVVTGITLVDFLPDEVTFVSANGPKISGTYNALEHTCTWSLPFMRPGEAVSLGLVAHVKPKTPMGTMITNSAVIRSNETPPSVAIAEAITYLKPLTVRASVSGSVGGQLKRVGPREEVTYTIQFQNRDNDSAVNNVSIVDKLPPLVSFVRARADDPSAVGRYDPKTHTYTWSYASLSPTKTPVSLDLVVEVNKGAPTATIISNSVTIDSDQTQPTATSVDVITYCKALSLSADVVSDIVGESEWVDVNDTFAYNICFNNDNDAPVTNVFIVDTLPKDVQFESADGNDDFGWYDPKAHTYTWSYTSLPPGSSTCLGILVRIKPGTAISSTLSNTVTIDSDETLPTTASVNVIVAESPLLVQNFGILPEIIRDTDPPYDIQATAIFPPGFSRNDIKDVLPTIYPGKISAKRQIIYASDTTIKVIALFDKNDLLSAIPESGPIDLTVFGKLKSGRSWCGKARVHIAKYTSR